MIASVDQLHPEGVELSNGQIADGDGVTGESLGQLRLSLGGVVHLPLLGLMPLHHHGKQNAAVLGAHSGVEGCYIGDSLGGVNQGDRPLELVQTADLHLHIVEGAGGQIGEFRDPSPDTPVKGVAVGIGEDHTEQPLLNAAVYLYGDLAQILCDGNIVNGLQIFRLIVHISPNACGQQEAQEENEKQDAHGRTLFLRRLDDHRLHMGLGLALPDNGLFGGPEELIHLGQLLIQLLRVDGRGFLLRRKIIPGEL